MSDCRGERVWQRATEPAFWVGIALAPPLALAFLGARASGYWFLEPALAGVLFVAAGLLRLRQQERLRTLETELDAQREIARAATQKRLELDEAKRRLITSVSHELKTPLTSIKGYAEILQARRLGPLTEKQDRALEILSRAVRREEALVENLLAFARLESGRYRIEREAFDLREVATAARDALLGEAARRSDLLVLALPGDPVTVSADRFGLETVLTHLAENALKFTPDGGIVEIRIDVTEERARVTVSDTGPGVPAALRPSVFAPFFQGDARDTREHGGAGLGLPIVKGILDAHGVAISVDERPGGGARFRFALPLVRTAVIAA